MLLATSTRHRNFSCICTLQSTVCHYHVSPNRSQILLYLDIGGGDTPPSTSNWGTCPFSHPTDWRHRMLGLTDLIITCLQLSRYYNTDSSSLIFDTSPKNTGGLVIPSAAVLRTVHVAERKLRAMNLFMQFLGLVTSYRFSLSAT